MKINYWSCEFSEYDEMWIKDEHGEDDLIRMYACLHPCNKENSCYHLNNKWNGSEDDCVLLDDSVMVGECARLQALKI